MTKDVAVSMSLAIIAGVAIGFILHINGTSAWWGSILGGASYPAIYFKVSKS